MVKGKTYSKTIAKAVKNFLDNQLLPYTFDSETGMFSFRMYTQNKILVRYGGVRVVGFVNAESLLVYAFYPQLVTNAQTVQTVQKFVLDTNIGIIPGNFEIHDGVIRYKTYTELSGGMSPSSECIANTLYYGIATLDRYTKEISTIISTNASKEDLKNIVKCKHYLSKGPDPFALYAMFAEVKSEMKKNQV